MPVSTRGDGDHETANALAGARPRSDPACARFAALFKEACTNDSQAAKGETALAAAQRCCGVAGSLPTSVLVTVTRAQTRTIDFAASNLRGSPVPLYLAGPAASSRTTRSGRAPERRSTSRC